MYEEILKNIRETYADEEREILERAFYYAKEAHSGQKRASGEEYFTHPVAVAKILMGLGMDCDTVAASFLHDVIEDTAVSEADIKNEFGMDVAALVAAHTKNADMTWEEVHRHKIEEMNEASFRVKLLILADMTANLRSLWRDYRHIGDKLWERFNAPKEKQAWYYGGMQDKLWEMQNYLETAEIYWEMVGLYKDLFVNFYIDERTDRIYQNCADGTCYVLAKNDLLWKPAELPDGLPMVDRKLAERIEDNWRDLMSQ